MDNFNVTTIDELEEYLSGVDREILFRGQTKHFGGVNSPAVISSFDRHGCIPSEMSRWTYYSHGALKQVLGEAVHSLTFSQAILQHYGWRSFYLDASSRPEVAAWFASHTYVGQVNIDLSEDCFEDPMFLRRPTATYSPEDGSGHLYLIDVEAARRLDIGVNDLASIQINAPRARFNAQSAWLLGPSRGNLPIGCFHSRIVAPKSVFAEYARQRGLDTTSDLFPSPDEDPVLAALLSLPWQELVLASEGSNADPIGIPAFRRTIEIPEYHDGFSKRYHPGIAFYRGKLMMDAVDVTSGPIPLHFLKMPEIVIFGSANPVGKYFPNIALALEKNPHLAFEITQLVRFPETGASQTYGKGLVVTTVDRNIVEVCDLVVDHPGMELTGGGVNVGWRYRIENDGQWVRVPHENDCPCGDDDRHLRHLSALTIINDVLGDPNPDEWDE